MSEETTKTPIEQAEPTPFPPALLADLLPIQQAQQQLQQELVRTLRGFFHAKDLDIERDHITVDLQTGTWRSGAPKE